MRPTGALTSLALGLRALLPHATAQLDARNTLSHNPHGRALPYGPLCPTCSCPLPLGHGLLVGSALESLEARLVSQAADALGDVEPGTLAEALLASEVDDLQLSVLEDLFELSGSSMGTPPDWIDYTAAENLDVAEVLRKNFAGVFGSKLGDLSIECSLDGGDDHGNHKPFSMDVVVEGVVVALDLAVAAPHNDKDGDLSQRVFVTPYPTKGLDVASLPALRVAYKFSLLVRTDAATKQFVADAKLEVTRSQGNQAKALSDLWDEVHQREQVPILFHQKEK